LRKQDAADKADVLPKTVEETAELGRNDYLTYRVFDLIEAMHTLTAFLKIGPMFERLPFEVQQVSEATRMDQIAALWHSGGWGALSIPGIGLTTVALMPQAVGSRLRR
jgi:hypothetical protein